MKKIVLFGAGGFSKEVIDLVNDINQCIKLNNPKQIFPTTKLKNNKAYHFANEEIKIVGIFDDKFTSKDKKFYSVTVLGTLKDLKNYIKKHKEIFLVISIANPTSKERIYNDLKKAGKVNFVNLIHPFAQISPSAKIGKGNIIFSNCVVSSDAKVDNFVYMNFNSIIGHDVKVGNFTSIMGHCDLLGYVNVGKKVYVGAGSSIIQNIVVEDEAFISMGSKVFKKVKKGSRVMGNPAKAFTLT